MWKHASLNRRYRLVWNRVRQCWSVAPEIASGQGKAAAGASEPVQADYILPLRALVVAIGCAFSLPALALDAGALPTGGTVVAGQASLSQSGSTLTVNQSTDRAILEWQSFNIGKDAAVHFNQNSASSVALNRVTGGTRSEIYGSLTANGQVYLVNSAGVLFGNTAQVNVGGIVASTLNISNTDFMNGNNRFVQGSGTGEVINQGNITARDGGTVALIGSSVSNTGQIVANGGNVALAAGQQVTFAAGANGHLQIAVDASEAQMIVNNGGLIQADGGQVILTAQGANVLASAVVSNTGTIQARTVAEREGKILLLAHFDSGTTQVAGTLDASAPTGGNGGFIETSAAHVKVAQETKVTTKAANGKTGTWLIDPTDFTVSSGSAAQTSSGIGADTLNANLQNTSVTLQTVAAGSEDGDINVNAAVNWSADTTLTLDAHGDININAAITATGTNAGLALNYGGTNGNNATTPTSGSNYNVKAPITLSGSNASLAINGNAYTLIHSMAQLDALDATGTGVSGYYALAQDLDASGTTYSKALVGTSIRNRFNGTFAGLGHTISNLTIDAGSANYVGLFGYTGNSSVIRDIGLLGGSIKGNAYVGGLAGQNSGSISNAYATGSVSGADSIGGLVGYNNSNISNAYATGSVTGTGDYIGGLVGWNDSGSISNAYATGSVTGSSSVGGLVGSNVGSISSAYASGRVSGGSFVGGLVGASGGSISNAYALGGVTGTGSYVGGLAGQNISSISNAYATGSVTGSSSVGGLVGMHYGTVTNAYWDSSSTGRSNAIGSGNGTVTQVTQVTSSNRYNHNAYGNFSTWNLVAGTSNVYAASDANGVQWIMIEGQTRPFLASEYSTTIGNAHQLQLMAYNLGAIYTLANDIDASATAGSNASDMWSTAGFVSVGDNSNRFTGQLDGGSHVVTGLTINRSGTDYVGLFSYTNSNSVIRNVGLVGGSMSGRYYVGGLVGWSNGGTINNAYTTGSVSGNGSVGGLIGWSNGSAISNAYATGSVSGISQYTGGLVGTVNGGSITNAYATGRVSGGNQFSGGLVGFNSAGNISNAYATGSVTGGVQVGGLVGENYGSVTSSFYATTDAQGNVINNGGATTGVFSGNTNGTGTTWLDLTNPTTFSAWDSTLWTFAGAGSSVAGYGVVLPYLTSVTRTQDIVSSTLFQSGQGTAGNPYTITTWQQLAAINRVLSGGYTYNLLNNLGSSTAGYSVFASATANGGAGWSPLGTNGNGFTGTFDGQSHTIGDLIINRGSTDYVGLFGYTGSGSVVRNIGLVGGSTQGRNYVGGLVGQNGGDISAAYSTGNVAGAGNFVGGLVGLSGGSISNAYASSSVTGSNFVGALVGLSGSNGSISNAYASGSVSGGYYVGGLVGFNQSYGSISNAYASGSVSGVGDVGGLVGLNQSYGNISNAYASGSVTGSSDVGGLIGLNSGGTVTSSFYATTDADGNAINNGGVTTGVFTGNADGAGTTWLDLTNPTTFSAWDSTLWTFAGAGSSVEGYGVVLPYLTSITRTQDIVSGTLFQSGQGTAGNPYTITTWQQLAGINHVLGAGYTYNLLNNLGSSTAGYSVFASATANGGAGWNPLGTNSNGFTGTFDGQSHTIGDLIINRGSTNYVGLFGYTGSGSDVRNIGLVGGSITGNYYVGGLVGRSTGNISAAYALSSVTGSYNAGGLVGWSDGNISNAYAMGSVTGGAYIGGLVGQSTGTISNAYASGSVSGVSFVGGLVGWNIGSISNAYATGSVTGTGSYYAGGLVGYNYNTGSISNAYATGSVIGNNRVGGLVGENVGSISNAYTTGSVTGSYEVGGLLGANSGGSVTSSFYATSDANRNAINNGGDTTGVFSGNTLGTGKTFAELTQLSTFTDAGWDIDDAGGTGKVWRIYDGHSGPLLRSFLTAVTISTDASAGNKTYDGTVASATFSTYDTSLGNSANAGQLLGSLTYRTTDKNADTYSLTDGTLILGGVYSGQQGYDISYADGAQPLTIGKANITVSTIDVSKTYDGTSSATGSAVLVGGTLFNNDNLSGGIFAFTDANAGTNKTVITSGVTVSDGNNGGNYAVTYADNTSSTIDKASITVTANGGSSTYGDTGLVNPGLSATGLVNGESASVLTGLTNSFGIGNTTNAGSYTLTVDGALSNGNYVVSQTSDGTWVVDRKTLTVKANDDRRSVSSQAYSGGNGVTYQGFVNGEGVSVLNGSLSYGGSAQGASRAGTYALSVSGLSADNYAIQYVDGRLLLTAPLTTPGGGELARPVRDGLSNLPSGLPLTLASTQPLYLTIMNDPISAAD